MRRKVIPTRGLRPELPLLTGFTAGAVLGLTNWASSQSLPLWVDLLRFAFTLAPIILFTAYDSMHHRKYRRAFLRTGLFAAAYITGKVLHHSYSDPSAIVAITTSIEQFGILALMNAIAAVSGGVLSVPVVWLMNRLFGLHVVQPGYLCSNCEYDLRGIGEPQKCPECGKSPNESDEKQRRAEIVYGLLLSGLCAILLLGGAFRLVPVFFKTTPPMYKFVFSLPSSKPSYASFVDPETGFVSQFDRDPRVIIGRAVNIAPYAEAKGVDASHISATSITGQDGRNHRIQFELKMLQDGFMLPGRPRLIWQLNQEETRLYFETGGLSDDRIDALLNDAKAQGWAPWNNERDFSMRERRTFLDPPW